MRRAVAMFVVLNAAAVSVLADGPADNQPDNVRRVPKLGVEIDGEARQELTRRLGELAELVSGLASKNDARIRDLLPDVQIYHRAVAVALEHREFFDAKEVAVARELLDEGTARARQLAAGSAPWASQTGLVVRGYISRIDGSVQPYGLVVPDSYVATGPFRHRLDLWFHGRGENLSEVNFLNDRRRNRGQFTPADTFVLHPYGRYCNAFKFAGEVDVLEALEAVVRRYRIDESRIVARGFSMGGAACWQFAVHYADRWVAAAPGAGFSETADFLKVFQKEPQTPSWYERKLWHWYDCTDYAANLYQCPTVAYSGEIDSQKQAADMMQAALKREGIDLVHVIGPKTGHAYHRDAVVEIDRRINSIAAKGRDHVPSTVHLTTYTLKYNRMHWVTIDALKEHWEQARVDAGLVGDSTIALTTANVAGLTLSMPSGWCPLDLVEPVHLTIDGEELTAPRPASDRSWVCVLNRESGAWKIGPPSDEGLRKRHDLQGPIDDAFMDSFIFVRPTKPGKRPAVDQWVASEMKHAIEHWRQQFRGDARVKNDDALTADDIAGSNLVLWGDPDSNSFLRQIAESLPIRWNDEELVVGERRFAAATHVPVAIYPNPQSPRRYVVLNSGFTYREYDYLNNARQVPKLPDWAVIDVRTPANSRFAGKIAAADFFGESWQLRPPHD